MRISRRNALAGAAVLASLLVLAFLVRDRLGLGSGGGAGDGERAGGPDQGEGAGGAFDQLSDSLFENWNDSFKEVDENGDPIVVMVVGRVFDISTGEPVPGVEVIFRGRGAEFAATSGGDGRYTISLGLARYSVAAVGDNTYGLVEREISLARSRDAITYDIGVVRLAHIAGQVVDAQGAPVGGASITFETRLERGRYSSNDLAQYMSVAASAESDSGGKFTLDVVPGNVLLIAEDDGAFGRASLPTVAPAASIPATIVLDASVSVAGTVVDAERLPVSEARVNVTVIDAVLGTRTSRDVTSGADGTFAIDRLSPGAATIEARAERGSSSLLLRQLASGEAATGIVLTIEPPVSVAGRVIDGDGSPLAGVTVWAHRLRARASPPTATTDDDGEFLIEGLGPGVYDVQAHKKGVGNAWAKGLTLPAKGVELTLAGSGVVRGIVRASTGKPVTSFSISVAQMTATVDGATRQGVRQGTQFASEDGLFELPVRLTGVYYLVATAPGFAPSPPTRVNVPPGGSGKVEFTLDSGGKVTGEVTSKADGRPIAGAQVGLLGGIGGPTATTDARGAFVLEGVPVGRRTLRAVHTDHVATTLSDVQIESGRATEVAIAMAAGSADDADKVDVAGIGAVVDVKGRDLRIYTVIEGGPAERAGLRAGDVIDQIDSAPTADMPLAEAVERLRGRPGTEVTIEVRRRDEAFSARVARGVVRASTPRRGAIALLIDRGRAAPADRHIVRRVSSASTHSALRRPCSGASARSTPNAAGA